MMGRGRGRGGGGGGGGRGRYGGGRGDGPSRFSAAREDPPPPRRSSGWGMAPPSRHLWVGSLGPGVTASDLSELFLRCGDVEGISRDPGRNFAFVTFAREEDAVAAVRELQGTQLRGASIRIEFSKGDKGSSSSMDDRYSQLADQRRFTERGRNQQSSPEKSTDKSKRSRPTEPSEVLWIGFPVGLKVDEATLWEAFSPFGEVVKITTFPGRTYAFVQYTTIAAACRAKEALQGNLFNNPRVSICFSRSDGVSAEFGKGSLDAPYSPHSNPSVRPIFREQDFEAFPRARPFDSPPRDMYMPSPHFGSKRLSRDPDDVGFIRDDYLRYGPGVEPDHRSNFEPFRTRELGPERRMSEELYEQHRCSPAVRGDAPWHNIPFERSQGALPLEDSWNARDNPYPFSKKLRTGEAHDSELPEYPFSEFDEGKVGSGYPRRPFYAMPEDDTHPGAYQLAPMHGRNRIDPLRNPTLVDRQPWHSQDSFSRHVEVERSTPEYHEPLLKEEWKWDGTIAKGGTQICRARCFPVGKVLNFMLPEFLDCTARTSLEMLAKHYYQAASSWVVFFVPENDADMAAYNEFMNYLGDKQRAAVCKLGERSSLFLVPPSDFSEQVLRVPGKVSISGVILKFDQSDPEVISLNRKPEAFEKVPPSLVSHLNLDVQAHEDLDASRRFNPPDIRPLSQGSDYLRSSPGSYNPASAHLVPPYKFGNAPSYLGPDLAQRPPPDTYREIAQDKQQQPPDVLPSRWSNPSPRSGNFNSLAQSPIPHTSTDRTPEAYSFATQGVPKGSTSGYTPSAGEASNLPFPPMQPASQQVVRPQQSPSLPVSLPPEQLAQLATLLAQQNQQGKELVDSLHKQSGFIQNLHGYDSMIPHSSSSIPVQNSLPPGLPSASQLQVHAPPIQGSVQPNPSIMLTSNAPMPSHNPLPLPPMHHSGNPAHSSMPLRSFVPPLPEGPPPLRQHTSSSLQALPALPSGRQTSQQLSAQEDHNGDPQKRLQATLQLAATLLHQIQQQSKPGGQK